MTHEQLTDALVDVAAHLECMSSDELAGLMELLVARHGDGDASLAALLILNSRHATALEVEADE
jgi:hypothetical protein